MDSALDQPRDDSRPGEKNPDGILLWVAVCVTLGANTALLIKSPHGTLGDLVVGGAHAVMIAALVAKVRSARRADRTGEHRRGSGLFFAAVAGVLVGNVASLALGGYGEGASVIAAVSCVALLASLVIKAVDLVRKGRAGVLIAPVTRPVGVLRERRARRHR